MTRIEEDAAARDELLDDWTERGLGRRVIRSHRRPRTWLIRHTLTVVALVGAVAALGGARADQDQTKTFEDTVTWAAAQVLPAPVEEEQLSTLADPAPRRAAEGHASRVQRREAPVRWVGPTRTALATSCYGTRDGRAHRGTDFDGETGDSARSIGAGTVVQAGYRYSNAGLTVVVDHGDVLSMYAHLSRAAVRVGQRVAAGTRLGSVGETGNATGSHLHLGIARTGSLSRLWDALVNPVPWLQARGVTVAGRCG